MHIKAKKFKPVGYKAWGENTSNHQVLQPELSLQSTGAAGKMKKLMGILNLCSEFKRITV